MKSFDDINWANEDEAREVYDALRAGGIDQDTAVRVTESECVQIIPGFAKPVSVIIHHSVNS